VRVHFNIPKAQFFDRAVIRDMDKKTGKVLSRFGAFVRTRARSLLNKKGSKKNPNSKPGQPPRKQTGILRQFVFFAYDPDEKAVIIGPSKTNQVFFDRIGQPVRGTVPEVLEYGGQITILEALYDVPGKGPTWLRADLRSKRRLTDLKKRFRTATIEARPYMRPAFEKEIPKLREWRKAA
jgi:hypothetical protein